MSDILRPFRFFVAILLEMMFGDAESRVTPGLPFGHERVKGSAMMRFDEDDWLLVG